MSSWSRALAEALLVVASILVAFALDAWWDNRSLSEVLRGNLVALQEDFEKSQQDLDLKVLQHSSRREAVGQLLAAGHEPSNAEPDSLSAWFLRVYQGHTFEGTHATLDALLSSGQLARVRSDSLAALLASWPAEVVDLQESESIVLDILLRDFYPATRDHIPLPDGSLFAREHVTPLGPDAFEFMQSLEFENLMAEFLWWEGVVLADGRRVSNRLESILSLLTVELDGMR